MASLSHISDTELRKKLRSYGINSPVTASTRNVLLKRLNHFISTDKPLKDTIGQDIGFSKTSTNRRSTVRERNNSAAFRQGLRESLNNFSSDEEEVEDFPSIMGHGSSGPSALQGRGISVKSLNSPKEDSSISSLSKKSLRKNSKAYNDAPSNRSFTSAKRRKSLRTNKDSSEVYNDKLYDTCSDSDTFDNNETKASQAEPYVYNNLNSFNYSFQTEKSRPKPFSQDYGGHESNYSCSNSSDKCDRTLEVSSPESTISRKFLTHSLTNGQNSIIQSSQSPANYTNGNGLLHSIPCILIILFSLFFGFLGICYLYIHGPFLSIFQIPSLFMFSTFVPNEPLKVDHLSTSTFDSSLNKARDAASSTFDLGNLKIKICEEVSKIDCLTATELESVSSIIQHLENTLIPALIHHARAYQCGNSNTHYATLSDLKKFLRKINFYKEETQIEDCLTGLGKLVTINSDLGIKAHWDDEHNIDEAPKLLGLTATNQPTEILCHLSSAFYSIIYCLIALAMGGLATWLTILILRYYKKQVEEQEQKSYELVEKILEILESSCGVSGKEFIAVNHVRDCLIAPRERKAKKLIWERAVKFIDEHDSRVYREIRTVAGEDCEVWRWVSGAPRSLISSPQLDCSQDQDKNWQGQAFESLEITQNLPQVSPTSCLKIRNMFDCEIEFGNDWPRRIQDSILEKCKKIEILHIAVDKASKEGCVYIKCASTKAAGQAFRALHGWWFDGNLVTVKYLRDEKYYERFPTAQLATIPLSPSKYQRTSLRDSLSTIHPTN